MQTLLLVCLTVLNWSLTFAVQWWDRRRLDEARRARAWNVASWGVAIVWFGLMSMVPWFWVTRQDWGAWRRRGLGVALARSAWVLLKGLAAAVAILVVLMLAIDALAAVLGVKAE